MPSPKIKIVTSEEGRKEGRKDGEYNIKLTYVLIKM
jgi:hypothetical protein